MSGWHSGQFFIRFYTDTIGGRPVDNSDIRTVFRQTAGAIIFTFECRANFRGRRDDDDDDDDAGVAVRAPPVAITKDATNPDRDATPRAPRTFN